MLTTPSTISSSVGNNQNESNENDDNNSYFDYTSDKEKEENYFKELDSDSIDNVVATSKDGQFGKVFYNYLNIIIIV